MSQPTYRIPAREVVPGMIYRGNVLHGAPWDRCQINGDKIVTVQLPGPSPRELACSCVKDEGLIRTGILRWYEPAAAPLCAHESACPVAPVPGRHGGLRLWPAPFHGKAWTYDDDCVWWECGNTAIDRTHLAAAGMGGQQNGRGDMVLQCFYLPPTPEPERSPAPSWDPYGTDLDLAVRYG